MTVNALQERVQRAIDELVASGRELGVQVAAYVRGELVVDACAGVADPGSGRPDVLRADVPAVGTMTARAAARMYAALIGEVDGVRLVSPERLAEMTAVAVGGPDWVFGADVERALGYSIEGGGAMFGASGSGGSLAGAAPAHGLALAATKNLLTAGEDDPMEDLRALILEAVA